MKKTIALGLIGLTALSAGTVLAMDSMGGHIGNNLVVSDIHNAIVDGDFDSFVDALAMHNEIAAEHMTENEFDLIRSRILEQEQVLEAIEEGNYQAFLEAVPEDRQLTEYSFNIIVEKHNAHEAVEDAIDNHDYQAWIEAVSALPHGENIKEIISEDDFDTLVELHDTRSDGDIDTVRELEGGLHGGMGMEGMGQDSPHHGMMGLR